MTDPRLEDHAVGLELQLVELVEQQQRAVVQQQLDDVARLDAEIAKVRQELATTAEVIGAEETTPAPEPAVLAPHAEDLIADDRAALLS